MRKVKTPYLKLPNNLLKLYCFGVKSFVMVKLAEKAGERKAKEALSEQGVHSQTVTQWIPVMQCQR